MIYVLKHWIAAIMAALFVVLAGHFSCTGRVALRWAESGAEYFFRVQGELLSRMPLLEWGKFRITMIWRGNS